MLRLLFGLCAVQVCWLVAWQFGSLAIQVGWLAFCNCTVFVVANSSSRFGWLVSLYLACWLVEFVLAG